MYANFESWLARAESASEYVTDALDQLPYPVQHQIHRALELAFLAGEIHATDKAMTIVSRKEHV